MVILVIRRLVWGITNRGSTVNKYIYIFIILLYPLAELNQRMLNPSYRFSIY